MIALLLAAQLSATAFQTVIDWETDALRQGEARLHSPAGVRSRSTYCTLAKDASDASFKLKRILLQNKALLIDPAAKASNGGELLYELTAEDRQRVELADLDMQRKAASYKIDCER